MTVYEAETLLRAWLRGRVPFSERWDKMERTSRLGTGALAITQKIYLSIKCPARQGAF